MWDSPYALYPYQEQAASTMVRSNVLLAYDMGCLAGDTELIVNRGGGSKRMRIDHVVRMFNGGSTSNMKWDLSIPTMVARADGGVARLAQVVNAWESGVKQTFTVTTDSGRLIRATDEHPFLTADGWKRLDELEVGTQVLVNVGKSRRGKSAPKRFYKQTFGMRYHPFRAMWAHRWAVAAHRIVAEAQLNGLDTQVFIDKVKAGDVSGLTFLDPEVYAVHHIDHDHLNNDPSNLEVLTHREHHQRHAAEGKANHVLDQIGIDVVESVVPFGEEMTYDIEVADDPHCFLANGFVVHNTGKTPTTLAAIERIRDEDEIFKWGTVLVPASLKYQWAREIWKFTDRSAVVIDGSPEKRGQIYTGLPATHPGYMISSYDTWVRDVESGLLDPNIANAFMILDEATAIKGFRSKRSKLLKKYRNRYSIRLALTGTPIENGKLEELFSILEWVDPDILPSWPSFESQFVVRNSMGWIERYKNVQTFHRKIKPYVLRKTVDDPDVASFMPEVVYYQPQYVPMDRRTYKAYTTIANDLLERLDSMVEKMGTRWPVWSHADPRIEDDEHPDGELMARIQVMRMLLDHPLAVLYSAARFEDPDDDRGSAFAAEIVKDGLLDNVVDSPKAEAVIEYLKDFFDNNDEKSKVVLFCSFIDVAHKIAELLPWKSVVFTSDLNSKQRDAVKQEFVSDPDVKVFVSTDAGGYGLDLPQANLLINYDLPWQAGLLKQRNARIRRASSEWKHVFVQDFIMAESIEERMLMSLQHKTSVADGAVDGKGFTEDGELPTELGSLRSFMQDVALIS